MANFKTGSKALWQLVSVLVISGVSLSTNSWNMAHSNITKFCKAVGSSTFSSTINCSNCPKSGLLSSQGWHHHLLCLAALLCLLRACCCCCTTLCCSATEVTAGLVKVCDVDPLWHYCTLMKCSYKTGLLYTQDKNKLLHGHSISLLFLQNVVVLPLLCHFPIIMLHHNGIFIQCERGITNNNIKKLTNFEKDSCDQLITKIEILTSLKQLHYGKPPGTDGLLPDFNKFFWLDINALLIDSIVYTIATGELSIEQKKGNHHSATPKR